MKPYNNSSSYMPSMGNFGLPSLNMQMNSGSTPSNSNSSSNKSPNKTHNSLIMKQNTSVLSNGSNHKPCLSFTNNNAQQNQSTTLEKNEENVNLLYKTEVELDKIMKNLDLPKIEPKQEQPTALNNSSPFNYISKPSLNHSGGSFEIAPGPSLFSTASNKQ